jgi:UPF0755 protein
MSLFTQKLLGSLFLIALIGGISLSVGVRLGLEARGPAQNPPILITVKKGMSLSQLGETLRLASLLREPRLFVLLARWRGMDRNIRSGNYEFNGNATPGEILEALVSGPQKLDFVVIREGLSLRETADALASAGLGEAARFRELAQDAAFAGTLKVPAATLEGFLFPDTYAFAAGATPEEILQHMTERFFTIFTPEMQAEGKALGLDPLQIVTLASLIEKEAAVASERPLISAVFRNRLRRGMKLQSDPTAIYDMQGHTGRVRPRHLDRESPYNTYKIKGLPPGPIANPGKAALEAAVRPAEDRKILYFVARNDRTHVFTRSYREHRRAIRQNR